MHSRSERIYMRHDRIRKDGWRVSANILIDVFTATVLFISAFIVDMYWEKNHTILLPYLIAILLCSRLRGTLAGAIVFIATLVVPYSRSGHEIRMVLTFVVAGLCSIYVGSGFFKESVAKRKANAALVRARREQELREQMVASLAHDLKNPLAAAKIASQVLRRQSLAAEQINRLSNTLANNLDKIDERLTDMLDASRVASGESLSVSPVQCELCAVVRDSIERMTLIHGNRFDLKCSKEEINGFWDPKAIARIIENLLGNAVKYGDANGSIVIHAIDAPREIDLCVTNSGKPLDLHKDVFQLYSRVENADVKPGWGIGLSVVRGLTQAHGGQVSIHTGIDWTKFTITLPKEYRVS